MTLTITIPTHRDPKFGYLSSASAHTFILGDSSSGSSDPVDEWLSVDHYLLAKQFEGTPLELSILEAPSLIKAQLIARPRNVTDFLSGPIPVKKVMYGSDRLFHIREDWSKVKNTYLLKATKAKFEQNSSIQKRLLDTKGTTIVDSLDPNNTLGKILMNIRASYLKDNSKTLTETLEGVMYKDYTSSTESSLPTDQIIDTLIFVTSLIKDKEGLDIFYPEMFEDALYNIGFGDVYLGELLMWMKDYTQNWSKVVAGMPMFYNLFKTVEAHISSKRLEGFTTGVNAISSVTRTSLLIAVFLKLINHALIPSIDTMLENLVKLRYSDIIIPKKSRKYRRTTPNKVHASAGLQAGLIRKDRFEGVTIEIYPKLIILKVEGGLDTYRPHIIAAAGKITSDSTVQFPAYKRILVEAMVFTFLSSAESKYEMAYKCWVRHRIELITDLKDRLAQTKWVRLTRDQRSLDTTVLGRAQNLSITPLKLILKILGLKTIANQTNTRRDLIDEFKKLDMPVIYAKKFSSVLSISPESRQKIITRDQRSLEDRFSASGGKASINQNIPVYTDFLQTFDSEMGWRTGPASTSELPPTEIFMHTLGSVLRNLTTEPVTIADVQWTFLTILAPQYRIKASNFLKQQKSNNVTILNDIRTFINKNKICSPSTLSRCTLFGSNDGELIIIPDDSLKKSGTSTPIIESEKSVKIEEVLPVISEPELVEPIIEYKVIEYEGNLQDPTSYSNFTVKWLCVVANCTGLTMPKKNGTVSENITRMVYEKYPFANIYLNIDRPTSGAYTPGDILVSPPPGRPGGGTTPGVITLFAEYAPGPPKSKGIDTLSTREKWLATAIEKLGGVIIEGDTIAISAQSLGVQNENFHVSPSMKILNEVAKKCRTNILILSPPRTTTPGQSDQKSGTTVYTKLFSSLPRGVDYTTLVTIIESMDTNTKLEWLNTYSMSSVAAKKRMVVKLTTQ